MDATAPPAVAMQDGPPADQPGLARDPAVDATPRTPPVTATPSSPDDLVRAHAHHAAKSRPVAASQPLAPSGPVLFARYAFGPNRLGLCGPEDWRSLLELGVAGASIGETGDREDGPGGPGRAALGDIDRGLRDLARGFEGAYPYLQLIAEANGLADALDPRVVDAYWIGNALSDRVDPGLMTRSMDVRFRARLAPADWRWLEPKPTAGARPTHAFHVFDVFPRVGLMSSGKVEGVLRVMDSCRIRWGTVTRVAGERLIVESVPLALRDGRLVLAGPRVEAVRRWLDGAGFVGDVAVGDTVSLHWDWACEVLSPGRLRALESRTERQLRLTNQTT